MTRHHLGFVLRTFVEHRDRSNLKLHLWTGVIGWIGLVTALSGMPFPFAVPWLGANVGAWFVVLSIGYWLPADALVAGTIAALTLVWTALPYVPWGTKHGVVVGVIAPLAVLSASIAIARCGDVYWHESASFLASDPPARVALERVHATLFGPFHFFLCTLLRHGWRPQVRAHFDERERSAQRTHLFVPWTNWAHLASCRAHHVAMPGNTAELVTAVREARERGQRVRVVGAGFSWSSLVPTNDTLLFCERLDRVEVDASNPEAPAVWVDAGVTNRKLDRALARHGLAMPCNVVLETVRIAGIASTGTHGSGKATSTVGDLVEVFEVVDAEGGLRVLSEETVGPEVMRAARLGLGLFGVIVRMKLRVVPLYRVRQTDSRCDVAAVLARLPELLRAHDSVELYWFPFNRDAWVRTIDRTDAPRTLRGHGFWFKAQNFLQNAWLVAAEKLVMRFAPSLTPRLLRVGMFLLPFKSRVLDLPESQHYHHWIEMIPAGCLEVGFKLDADAANVRAAWATTERLVDDYARRELYPLNLTLNVRFTGSSCALLTPAYGDGITAYIEIMWMGRPKGWAEFSSELCREWLKTPGALPHWAKEFEHVDDVISIARAHLGDRRERFLRALTLSGVDPDRRFWNPLIHRILDDPPEPMGAMTCA